MTNLRLLAAFVVWLCCLGAACAAVFYLQPPYGDLAVFLVWSGFVVFTIFSVSVAALSQNTTRKMWISMAVFATASVVVFIHADANNLRTVGTVTVDLLFSESPLPPPYISSPEQSPPPPISDETWRKWLLWENHSNNISHLIDLFVASCLAMVGACVGKTLHRLEIAR